MEQTSRARHRISRYIWRAVVVSLILVPVWMFVLQPGQLVAQAVGRGGPAVASLRLAPDGGTPVPVSALRLSSPGVVAAAPIVIGGYWEYMPVASMV